MTKHTYNVADKVRILATPSNSLKYPATLFGKDLIVRRVRGSSFIAIEGRYGWINVSDVEPVNVVRGDEVKVGTYIISIQHPNGTFAPNPTPRVYSSDVQARKVARQMAKKHGGKFIVFKATDEFVMPSLEPEHRAL